MFQSIFKFFKVFIAGFDLVILKTFKSLFNVCVFLRERESMQAGEGQRERKTQNLKQALGSELSAQSLVRGSNSQIVRS